MEYKNVNATTAFSSKAEKYARYRWDYAPQAIQTIFDITQISPTSTIADIGAGTGILTRHFVGKVKQVYAIEPNPEMRRIALRNLRGYPGCQIMDGQAEAIPLPDKSVDLITVAQSIHWFEPQQARLEFLRILKIGGWLAILNNDAADDEIRKAIRGIFTEENGVLPTHKPRLPEPKPLAFFYGNDEFLKQSFPFTLREGWEAFTGSLCSTSYAPNEQGALYIHFEHSCRRVFDRFSSEDGLLELHGITELSLGRMLR